MNLGVSRHDCLQFTTTAGDEIQQKRLIPRFACALQMESLNDFFAVVAC